MKYEDKIASTKHPSTPIVWRVVYDPLIGVWTPYGELPVYPWEVNTKDLIKATIQLAEDEVFTILYDVFVGRSELTVNGTTVRIGADEMHEAAVTANPTLILKKSNILRMVSLIYQSCHIF